MRDSYRSSISKNKNAITLHPIRSSPYTDQLIPCDTEQPRIPDQLGTSNTKDTSDTEGEGEGEEEKEATWYWNTSANESESDSDPEWGRYFDEEGSGLELRKPRSEGEVPLQIGTEVIPMQNRSKEEVPLQIRTKKLHRCNTLGWKRKKELARRIWERLACYIIQKERCGK